MTEIEANNEKVNSSPFWEDVSVQPWTIHLGYWAFIVMFFGLFWGSNEGYYGIMILCEIVLLPTKIAAAYIIIYYIIPRFLIDQRYVTLISLTLLTIVLFATLQRVIAHYYLFPWKSFNLEQSPLNVYEIMHQVININTALVIPIGFKLVSVWVKKKLEAKDFERQNIETELRFLKNQLQPHFLFNTLNNLYGLILKKSDLAKGVTLKLSDLMRYTLYETNVDLVNLESELKHIKNYIDLEKIRHEDKLDVAFNLYGDQSGLRIAPMLILHFVENSFKHGLSASKKGWISIDISTMDREFTLKIENSLAEKKDKDSNADRMVSGIGLENVQRQLNLIYPDKHNLKIENNLDSFLVILKLTLSK